MLYLRHTYVQGRPPPTPMTQPLHSPSPFLHSLFPPLPSLFSLLYSHFPSAPLPLLPILLSLRIGPLNPARGPGERSKPPQRRLGQSPAEIEFGAF